MSLTKFARVEILDVYGSNQKIKTASLAKASEFNEFHTEDGYLYARLRAISSRVNKNHDAWPSVEIAGDHELIHKLGRVATREASLGKEISGFRVSAAKNDNKHFIVEAKKGAKFGFSTFLGKPIFVDHNNSNHRRSRGVIVDSRLHVEPYSDDPYYKTADCHESFKPPTWVELLLEIDAKAFPKFAKAIVDGAKDPTKGIDGFSMGANVERSTCSHCANVATNPDEFCQHIKGKGAYWDYIDPKTGSKTSKRSFEFCLPGDTPVLLHSGDYIPIEDIVIGDKVLDHMGDTRVVTKTMVRDNSDFLYEINRVGQGRQRPVTMTGNHPVLAISNPDNLLPHDLRKRMDSGRYLPEFIEARNIQVGDMVAELSPYHQVKVESLKTSNYVILDEYNDHEVHALNTLDDVYFRPEGAYKDWIRRPCGGCGQAMALRPSDRNRFYCSHRCYGNYRKGKEFRPYNKRNRVNIPESITLDYDFGRWCGWYLAEGDIAYNYAREGNVRSESSVRFTLHLDEVQEREEILNLGNKIFGLNGKVEYRSDGAKSVKVVFHNRPLAQLMANFGTTCYTKNVPTELTNSPIEFIRGIVSAHEDGDGTFNPNGLRPYEHLHTTSSPQLGNQLYHMNIWLGNTPGRRMSLPNKQNKRTVPADIVYYSSGSNMTRGRFHYDNWTFAQVNEINVIEPIDKVYNLEVEDTHTYIAGGQVVHNCGGVQYFEISGVFDPADETALSMGIVASLQKEGEEHLEDGPADMYYQWKRPQGEFICPGCHGDGCPTCEGKGVVYTPNLGDDGVISPTNISPDDVTRQVDPSVLGPIHQGSIRTAEGVEDINTELYGAPTAVEGGPARPAPWTEDPAKREQIIQKAIAKARRVEGGMAQLHTFLRQAGIDPITAEFYNQYGEEDIDPLRGPEGKYLNGPLMNPALNRVPGISQMPPGDLAKDEGFEQIPYQVDPYANPQTYRNDAEGLSVRPSLDNSGEVRNNEVDVNGLPIGTPAPNRPGGVYDQEAPTMNDPRWSSVHEADNTPQVDLLRAPEPIDTLSSPVVCPVCGEEIDGEQCPVCGAERPPEGFDDPDLQKAHENVERRLEGEAPQDSGPAIPQQDSELLDKNLPPQDFPTKHYIPTAHVNSGMPRWRIVEAGVINNNDKLIKPGNKPATNEPVEKVLSDQLAPVTSKVHTAADFLAAAGHLTNTGDIMERTADATAQAPEVAKPKTQVDVVGVGGVDEATNEEASKPSVGEVDVLGIGGVDSDVAADEHETLPDSSGDGDAGFNTDKTTDGSGPTRTWNNGYGDSLGQHDPVTRDPFPAHAEGVTSAQRTAYDNEPYPKDDGGLAGGHAQSGNEPIDPSFKADDRVDLLQTVTSPENNSGPTKTWSGTDGNGVNKQQDPVTKDQYPPNDGFGKGSSQHLFAAFKLADEEVKVGLITEDQKYARVAELENDPHEVTAGLKYVARLKAAGLGKREATVKRLPSLQGQRTASTTVESALDPTIDGQDDWAAFL